MPYLTFWKSDKFIHVYELPSVNSDSDIWQYAFQNNLVIITKDSDFYYRYLSSGKGPKVVWIKTGNLKKKIFNQLIKSNWAEIEEMLLYSSFIIVNEEKIQGY
jgi:predicted nuclease of predicted toxin-antitoxin system